MNKLIYILLGLILSCSITATKTIAQNTIANCAVFAIVDNATLNNAAQINFINSISQNDQSKGVVQEKQFLISSDNGIKAGNLTQNIASFSITNENKSPFTISLPSRPITLTNSKNGNTIQVSGWKSNSQVGQAGSQKNVKVINLGASLQMGSSVNEEKSGEYSGTYPVTLVYY